MDAIGEAELAEIERRIVARMVEAFDVDLAGLVLDMTNFATWIDSANDRAPIAQRGHSKQKRSDLRLVGLGLVVSTDGGIPLVSHAYPGNRPDVTQFPVMVEELGRRFGALPAELGKLTLVFDAGQNSEDNYELLATASRSISSARSRRLTTPTCSPSPRRPTGPWTRQRFPGLSAFEAAKTVLGAERRIVVTHSETSARQAVRWASTRRWPKPAANYLRSRLASPGARPARPKNQGRGGDRPYPPSPLGLPGGLGQPQRGGALGAAPDATALTKGPGPPRRKVLRQAGTGHRQRQRPRHYGRSRGRLPLPGGGRG